MERASAAACWLGHGLVIRTECRRWPTSGHVPSGPFSRSVRQPPVGHPTGAPRRASLGGQRRWHGPVVLRRLVDQALVFVSEARRLGLELFGFLAVVGDAGELALDLAPHLEHD